MANKAAHPIHAYTTHTFSLETGELLTIDDIFNEKFIHFAEKYISNDLESVNQRNEGRLFFGRIRDNIADKLKNNEWYLTKNGFSVIFANEEITGYAVGPIVSTIPWEIAEEYLKKPEITIERMDHSIKDDSGNLLAEIYYDKPVIFGESEAVKKINQYFEDEYSDWLNNIPADINFYQTDMMTRFLGFVENYRETYEENLTGHPFYNKIDTTIVFTDSDTVSIRHTSHWSAGGVYERFQFGYNFNLHTGELLPFSYFYDVNADKFRNGLYNFVKMNFTLTIFNLSFLKNIIRLIPIMILNIHITKIFMIYHTNIFMMAKTFT